MKNNLGQKKMIRATISNLIISMLFSKLTFGNGGSIMRSWDKFHDVSKTPQKDANSESLKKWQKKI